MCTPKTALQLLLRTHEQLRPWLISLMSTMTLSATRESSGRADLLDDRRQSSPKQTYGDVRRVNGFSEDFTTQIVDDDNNDRGVGTSAAGATMMAKLGGALGSKYLDITSLLKDPLIFLPERFPDQATQKIPYEPLPSGPQQQVCREVIIRHR